VNVAVAGGHGQIARALEKLLVGRGDTARGLIRNPDHADDLRALGAEPVLADLEAATIDEVAGAISGADSVVFAAGAGPGSGSARKDTMDYGGAAKLIQAAQAAGVRRYVMVSAMGAADPPGGDETFAVYLRAKARADEELRTSGLDFTIVRPGMLTDDPPTGRVKIAERLERGAIPRADVAAVLLAVLDDDATIGTTFDLVGGDEQIADALRSLRPPG
jgi:uncharacterized protein YbjT (DUF2867 family)